jgi:mitochondrial fission protein ELM1
MEMKILALKDKRPGHFRQSDGVVKALARRHAVSAAEIRDVAASLLPGGLQRLLCSEALPAGLALRLWGLRVEAIEPPDLIVSAGAATLAPNVLLARRFGAKNVFIGSPRGLPPRFFSAVLRAAPDDPKRTRQIRVLKPSSVDPDELAPPRPIRCMEELSERRVALLVGGDTPRYRFLAADWEGLARLVRESAAKGLQWEITSSPRTPDAAADRLAALAAGQEGSVRYVDFRVSRAGSIEPLLNADAILVTEDSNSMTAEAVAARRPVVVLRSGAAPPEEPALAFLLGEARVAVAPMTASPDELLDAIGRVRPIEHHPLDRLYDQLVAAGAIPSDKAAGAGQA